jgi:molecular chaperone GrpE
MPENNTNAADAALDEFVDSTAPFPASNAAADQKIADLERRVQEETQRALRGQAELENYRKRSQRELAEERRFAVIPLVRDLLPVLDNLERAIEAAGKEGDSGLLAGVKMVATQLEGVLKQHQCIRIETVGAQFDPNLHQAIAQEPSDQIPAGSVTRAAQSGFKLEGRVIRPAQVFVSTGPAT